MNPSETPLSDLILPTPSDETYARFLELFLKATLGVVAVNVPDGSERDIVSSQENPIRLGMTDHAAGRALILAFADPDVFRAKFGLQFNAGMVGKDVLAAVLANPKCDGVLVNSAKEERSIMIDRDTSRRLLNQPASAAAPKRKPWWKFW